MLISVIKYTFIYLGAIYTYHKILNIKKQHKLYYIFTSIALSILTYFLKNNYKELAYAIPLLLFWISTTLTTHHPKINFISTIIAFGLSHTLHAFTSLFLVSMIAPLFYKNSTFSFSLLVIPASLLQITALIYLFNVKRFQKGMPFLLNNNKFINLATFICLLVIAFITPLPNSPKRWLKLITILLFILTLAILIYWWQSELTKTYKHRLLLRELESLRTETQEKDKLIAQLMAQNQELGRLIHRDNKRIPAMENAVCEYLAMDVTDVETLRSRGIVLREEIQKLSTSRSLLLAEFNDKRYRQHATEILSLDALLNYIEKRAAQEHIKFSVHFGIDLRDYVPQIISEEDLTHLLSDLLDNACIAATYATERVIQLQFYMAEKAFVIEIADSGIPFESASLANFGLEQYTSHKDTGGSGIGLMDIWKIKEKYRATIHIEEYETPAPYSKKISLIFNHKNRYTIQTYRKEDISKKIERSDLQIY